MESYISHFYARYLCVVTCTLARLRAKATKLMNIVNLCIVSMKYV